MRQETTSPIVLAQARTSEGVAFQLRRDSKGVLEVPGLANVLISIHVGAPAKLACRRDGKRHTGTAVHGDIDIIPANTPSRWEMQDENDTALLLSLPQGLLRSVANGSGLDPAQLEIRNRFQIRDNELEALSWAMKREMESAYPSGRLYLDGPSRWPWLRASWRGTALLRSKLKNRTRVSVAAGSNRFCPSSKISLQRIFRWSRLRQLPG